MKIGGFEWITIQCALLRRALLVPINEFSIMKRISKDGLLFAQLRQVRNERLASSGGNCCCNANKMLEGMVLWHATTYLLLTLATANSVIWE